MLYLVGLLPIFIFVMLFVGSGIYFTFLGTSHAFYQISPVVAIIPALATAWLLHKPPTHQKMKNFLDGIRHPDIITMCIIFLLAGAFSQVTQDIGSVKATINCALNFMPFHWLLVGLFIISAAISMAIGTSMGTIAAITPIAVGLSTELLTSPLLYIATVVGGSMFGDNLSFISDTTIAAVASQNADMQKKFKINAQVALIASCITIAILLLQSNVQASIEIGKYNIFLIAPYVALITLALYGCNVFVSLFISLLFAGIIGCFFVADYTMLSFCQSISKGFASMHEIMLLSLMVGGLSGLTGKHFFQSCAQQLSSWIQNKRSDTKIAQLIIAALASLFDILLANNTIAIILSGEIAREVAKNHNVPAHYSAAWLDVFATVFQGLIPWGAQILLASSVAGVSPLSIVPYVYYCYVLGIVSICYICIAPTYK